VRKTMANEKTTDIFMKFLNILVSDFNLKKF